MCVGWALGQHDGPLSYAPHTNTHPKHTHKHSGIEVAWNQVELCGGGGGGGGGRLDAEQRERLFGEIRVLSQLRHRNVMSLFDWWCAVFGWFFLCALLGEQASGEGPYSQHENTLLPSKQNKQPKQKKGTTRASTP